MIRELQSKPKREGKPPDEESNKGKEKTGVCDDQSEVKERMR